MKMKTILTTVLSVTLLNCAISLSARADSTDYSQGYRDGFQAGSDRCRGGGDHGGGGGHYPPTARIDGFCNEVNTGWGYRYELELRDSYSNHGRGIVVASFDGEGTQLNQRYCRSAIDDLRRTDDRYLCVGVKVLGGSRFDLLRTSTDRGEIQTSIVSSYNGQGTVGNFNNCQYEIQHLDRRR